MALNKKRKRSPSISLLRIALDKVVRNSVSHPANAFLVSELGRRPLLGRFRNWNLSGNRDRP